VLALRERRLSVLLVPIAPALVNVAVVVAQYLRLWSPIANAGRGARWQPTGLIGNTNDTGSYLMFVAIPVVALAMASKRWRRLAVIVSVVLVLGIFLTTTLSAVIGLAAGLVVLAALRSFRTVAVIVVICSLLGGMALMFYPPLHERWDRAQNALKEGDYDRLFSYRFAGYLTACLIAADHPVVGLGPGTYGWAYFDYRQRAEQRFPILMRSQSRMFNFAEAHNDHLQVLAQTGFPGLLLLGAAMVLVGRKTFRITGTDERAQFVRYAALPLTTAFGVLALAQFPLELTATTHTLLFFTAAIVAWGDSA
jgi:O-antigen ligase